MIIKYTVCMFQVAVHAHDRNSSVCTVISEQEGVADSLDTWHSGKEVIKAMKKITSGAQKWSGNKYVITLHFSLLFKLEKNPCSTTYNYK